PEPVEVGVVGVLLLDDDYHVLERPRQVRRQGVECLPDVVVEGHQRGRSGARTWNAFTATTPNRNPPTCAANATPPLASGCVSENPPCHSWKTNQKPRKNIAGIGMGRKPNSSVTTRAWGRSTKYAPRTPAIAPLAPTVGTLAASTPEKCRVTHACASAAANP